MKKLIVVDHGAGNLASVKAVLSHLTCEFSVVSHGDALEAEMDGAQCILLPGVGNGAYMMGELMRRSLVVPLVRWVREDKPLLGICVGAQVLLSMTHEGNAPCLNLIEGECCAFASRRLFARGNAQGYKVPHMGWNEVIPNEEHEAHPLFRDIPPEASFYFVNSYYFHVAEKSHALAYTDYGMSFASVIGKGRVIGVQFHPEKSGVHGIVLLRNFFTHIAGVL